MTVALVTGANTGVGREAAGQPVERGHDVYIGARSVERGVPAAETARAVVELVLPGVDGPTGTPRDESGPLQC